MIGDVLHGSNNIYTVEVEGRQLQCRIRGKILRPDERMHNPIAVGDRVRIAPDPHSDGTGWIIDREERRSAIMRYNKKRRAPQVLAANVDYLICVSSTQSPPFRPRFVDRLLISAEAGGAEAVIFVNKCDLGAAPETMTRIEDYRRIGYQVIQGSATTGQGIETLSELLRGHTSVVIGQSGVGKTSLLNRLEPGIGLRVGELSSKWDRGAHTTTFAVLIRLASGGRIIDTPGIRELDVHGLKAEELSHYYPEFEGPARDCRFSSCDHVWEETCAVRDAVERGEIHPDRYEGYVRLFGQLKEE